LSLWPYHDKNDNKVLLTVHEKWHRNSNKAYVLFEMLKSYCIL